MKTTGSRPAKGAAATALLLGGALLLSGRIFAAEAAAPRQQQRLLLAHYMPWFASKPVSGVWGWHWTMGRMDTEAGKLASHFTPLMGPYDSGDPDALQCQVMLWKLSGIDGVIVDWYGTDDLYDYAAIHRNVERLVPLIEQAGLHFAICYENQVIPNQLRQNKLTADAAVAKGQEQMRWLDRHWFPSSAYVRIGGKPLLLTFGDSYFSPPQWTQVLSKLTAPPILVMENDRQRAAGVASGGFDWPAPREGWVGAKREQDGFYTRAAIWSVFVPDAFPRFQDFYAQAGVGNSYGKIEDRDGRTYRETLTRALQSNAPVVQVATWNDWGEGTQIEPSVEFGYRDLEATREVRRSCWGTAAIGKTEDLRLPILWYRLRKRYSADPAASQTLSRVVPLIILGKTDAARQLLTRYTI